MKSRMEIEMEPNKRVRSKNGRVRRAMVPSATRLTRWLLARGYLESRTVTVLEFPKAGGTWLAKMISTTLEWPFLDDTPTVPGNNCVLRGHQLPADQPQALVYLVRDPRDVYQSLFHHRVHHWNSNVHYRKAWLTAHRDPLASERIREQMLDFLRFEEQFVGERGSASPATWAGHVKAWEVSAASEWPRVLVRYEDLLREPAHELVRIYGELFAGELPLALAEAVAAAHDFKLRKLATAHPQVGRSFARKGVAGGWQHGFTRAAGEELDRQAGDVMVRLGYVDSREWWRGLDD